MKVVEFLNDLKKVGIAISKLTNQALIVKIITAVTSIQGVNFSKRINELIIASTFIVLQRC